MKKNNLAYVLLYLLLAGISFYFAITYSGNQMVGMFYGLAGVFGGFCVITVMRYFYWQTNKEKYQEKLEIKEIEMEDELKQKLRDRSGRYAYKIGMLIIALSIIVYSALGVLNIMDTEYIVIYLGVYLMSQVFIGIIVFNHLLKKYD